MNIHEQLKQARSFDTAYQVDDYPYGFTLRCKIRYWVEYKPKLGFRFCSCTTNPKKSIEQWNKPKLGTYSLVAGFLVQEEETQHIKYVACSGYGEAHEIQSFIDRFNKWIPEDCMYNLNRFLKVKIAYDAQRETLENKEV